MNDMLFVFSVVLAGEGCFISDEFEKARKMEIRSEISILIPSIKYLLDSVLTDGLALEGNKMVMQFYLLEAKQHQLFQQLSGASRSRYSSAMRMLFLDLERIKQSATQTLIRIGDLTKAASILTSLPENTEQSNSIVELSQDDAALWKFICSQKGKSRQLEIGGDFFDFQFELFPKYTAEPIPRYIRAKISSIGRNKVVLSKIKEYQDQTFAATKHESFPVEAIPLYPRNELERRKLWGMLYAAYEYRLQIDAEVVVALHNHSLQPAYVELSKLYNAPKLVECLGELYKRTTES